MKALGAYFHALREGRNLSVMNLAAAIGTSPTHIWRVENGKNNSIGAEMLFAFVDALGGDVVDAARLFQSKSATEEDGRQLAIDRLTAVERRGVEQLVDVAGKDRVLQAIEYLQELDETELIDVLIRLQTESRAAQSRKP